MSHIASNHLSHSVTELKQIHQGRDIWVIALGPSMKFIEPVFFENKLTVGVNRVSIKFDCTYIVAKDPAGFNEIKNTSGTAKLIISKHEGGVT